MSSLLNDNATTYSIGTQFSTQSKVMQEMGEVMKLRPSKIYKELLGGIL